MMNQDGFLPYAQPLIGEEELNEVRDTLESGWLARGPKCSQFEKRFADFVGSKYAVGTNCCTSAMFLALKAMGVGPGDEVITSPLTFPATVNVIIHVGARPVLADIDPQTLTIDPDEIAKKISPRTKVLLPVHYAGQACEMDQILTLARTHGLKVLEDGAHAVYTGYRDKMVGSIGDATAFSFYVTKNMITGEGGMLTTNDEGLAHKVRLLSLHGVDSDAWKRYGAKASWYYQVLLPGYKCNMNDIQAALGLRQLDRLEEMQRIRENYAKFYSDGLKNLAGITVPYVNLHGRHAWHLYVIQVNEKEAGVSRDKFIEEMRNRGIGTSVHFIPIHMHPYYAATYGYKKGDLPVTERVFEGLVSLPLYPKMSIQDAEKVIKAVRDIVGSKKSR